MCNVPSYSTDAVAHLVITFVLTKHHCPAARRARQGRQVALHLVARHDPHFELAGKTIGLVGGTGAIGTKLPIARPRHERPRVVQVGANRAR